jgi:hypothetical protein
MLAGKVRGFQCTAQRRRSFVQLCQLFAHTMQCVNWMLSCKTASASDLSLHTADFLNCQRPAAGGGL